jgi:Ca2+-transporting ATPase
MVKGALDILLDLCTDELINGEVRPLENERKQKISEISNDFSANFAYRNLGFAYRDVKEEDAEILLLEKEYELVETCLTFVGFAAMIDPPRDESRPAIMEAKQAGIEVMMITGDHKETAKAISKAIALSDKEEPVTGMMLDEMDDKKLDEIVDSTKIFARVNPAHKLRIVNSLKRKEEVVIMTGDGVNDSPALKRADIGVAMGITGTDVAKEASEMILVDDNFANIIDAVSEGRIIYDNMKKFISYLLSANAGEILTVLFGLILSSIFLPAIRLPVAAIQLLYINIVTDVFPALALGVSAPDHDVMRRPPRDPNEPLLDRDMISKIFITGFLYAIGTMVCYYWALGWGQNTSDAAFDIAQTMVFVSLMIFQFLNSISTSVSGSVFSRRLLKNRTLFGAVALGVVLVMLVVYIPPLNPFIQTTALTAQHWGIILAICVPILVIEEIRKFIFRRKFGSITYFDRNKS